MKLRTSAAASLIALSLIAAACGSDDESSSTTAAPATTAAPETTAAAETTAAPETSAAAETTAAPAADVCPEKLTIQTDWYPELEHGGTYQLIGPDGTADKDTLTYSGPVQPQYAVGGLKELTIAAIRSDGKRNSSVLLDGEADMAYITYGDVVADSKAVPMTIVAKTLDKDPQMIMWDPAQFDIKEPADIAKTGAPVVHFPGTSYIDYMLFQGYMTPEQDDPSYDGSDAKWIANNGAIFQQGFVTAETFYYENIAQWKDGKPAPVASYTVAEMGFDNYPATIAMMSDKVTELDACLTLLVPKMQQAWVDFFNDPKPITDKMIEINQTYDTFWQLTADQNAAGMKILDERNLGSNSADGTYCSIDDDRATKLYGQLKELFDQQGVEITDDPSSVYTNKYCAGAPGR